MSTRSGWGALGWGSGDWGGEGDGAELGLVNAVAHRENVMRLQFSEAVYFSGLQDPTDAGLASHYAVAPVDGTSGYDGQPARPVTVLYAAPALDSVDPTTFIDLFLDRPMSPYPSAYAVTAVGLVAQSSGATMPAAVTLQTPAVYRALVPPSLETSAPARDLANPQTLADAVGSGLPHPQSAILGTYTAGGDGDLASDSGLVSLRKRIYRRLLSVTSRFAHLPGYGVGVPLDGQRLARTGERVRIAAEAERQIALEPEVEKCRVAVAFDNATGLARYDVLVRTRGGQLDRFTVTMGQ